MAFQTTIEAGFVAGLPGQPGSNFPSFQETENYYCEDSSPIQFGKVVSKGTADNQATIGGSSIVGVTMRKMKEVEADGSTVQYNQYDAMTVMRTGELWVNLENTGSKLDDLWYDTTTGNIGAGTAGAGQAQLPTGCKLLTAVASPGGIGKVRLVNVI